MEDDDINEWKVMIKTDGRWRYRWTEGDDRDRWKMMIMEDDDRDEWKMMMEMDERRWW